jgi:archaetidylinositol phosphate synthase
MTEFCEQMDPEILLKMKQSPHETRRVQESFVAAAEKQALLWLAARTPNWVGPDHLTLLGFAAQIGAGACYVWARWDRFALLGVICCLALNWLGDSLDGTLARFRQRLRPRYGFYVDHMIDSFGALALMGGMALSGYMHPSIAIGLLIAFLMLSIQSYLATHTLREFRLSFWRFGPTELRILLMVGSLALLKILVGLAHMNYFASDAIAIVVCCLANFLVSDEWVFRVGKKKCREKLAVQLE